MGESLEAVAFLARSEIRAEILRALADQPLDRRELAAATGASQSSLSRSLPDLEDRGWIRRRAGTYHLTTAGSLIVERFLALLGTVSGLQTLGEGLDYLPVEEMGIDIRHFADARRLTAEEFDPTAPYQYGIKRLRDSRTVRSAARVIPPPYVRALQEEVETGSISAEVVLDPEYVETFEGTDIGRHWADIADGADVLLSDGHIPYRLIVLEDVVHLWLCSENGDQAGLLESESERVRAWAEATVDEYIDGARPLGTALLE